MLAMAGMTLAAIVALSYLLVANGRRNGRTQEATDDLRRREADGVGPGRFGGVPDGLSGLTVLFGLALTLAAPGCGEQPERFTDDHVVAQFVNGVITTDQLVAYIDKIGPKCHMPAMGCHVGAQTACDSDKPCGAHSAQMAHGQTTPAEHTGMSCCGGQHGGAHAGCCGGSETALKKQPCKAHENCCMQHYDLKVEDYRVLVKAMVLEQMLQEYIREKGIGQEEDIQDLIKYVTEKVYVTDTHLEMEENMKPAESAVRRYYEGHKRRFGLKTLSEARDEIEKILKKEMHREAMPKYLAELKRNAFIRKDLELIEPREPSEFELRSFYREHRSEYEEPEKIKIRRILTHSRQRAEQAQSRLMSGMSFAAVAEKYSEGPFADSGGEEPFYIKKGDRSKIFEKNVFRLHEGDFSLLFEDNGDFYIVQVIEKQDKRVKGFEEVADSIRKALMEKKEKEQMEDNAKRTLFTVNNRSYTVEEFKRRYDHLPFNLRAQFSGFPGKEKLVDRMIEYELLVDDAHRKMYDLKNKETVREITNSILQGTLYEKEVIGRIGIKDISDEEAREYYHKNKKRLMRPPKAKVSFIRIPVSDAAGPNAAASESQKKAAKRKADKAYRMIKDGFAFDVVAREYSADGWSARKLEMYEEGNMLPVSLAEVEMHPLHRVIFAMQAGEVSKPFEFQGNYYIFKLWEKSEKDYVAFGNVKKAIKRLLVVRKRRELAETLKSELMEKSQLVLNERALQAMAKKWAEKKTQTAYAGHSG